MSHMTRCFIIHSINIQQPIRKGMSHLSKSTAITACTKILQKVMLYT